MRILVYGINGPPELSGIGKFTGEMIEHLAQRHEVRLVTTAPHYPLWRPFEGYSNTSYSSEQVMNGSLKLLRCPVWLPSRLSGISRIGHAASFVMSSLPVILSQMVWRPHLVFVVAPSLTVAPIGWFAGRCVGAKLWLHIQDFEVDAAFALGILKDAKLQRVALSIESTVMRHFDRVSTISEAMLRRLISKSVAHNQAKLFPNWVDTDFIRPLERRSEMRAPLAKDDEVVALYAGSMGEKQGLDVLLEAASMLRTVPKIRFVLCGDGGSRTDLMERYRHLENVTWLPQQPLQHLNELLNAADIHVLPQRADAADLVMPSKLTGMMASGRPTVASSPPHGELAAALTGAGIVVQPGNAEAFAEAIRKLTSDPALRRQMGTLAREHAVARMGKRSILSDLEAQLQELVNEPADQR